MRIHKWEHKTLNILDKEPEDCQALWVLTALHFTEGA